MYHSGFTDAVNYKGERIRDERGSTVAYCGHRWIVKIRTKPVESSYGGLCYTAHEFDMLEILCLVCGEVEFIDKDNIVTSEEWNKRIGAEIPYVGLTETQKWEKQDKEEAKRARKRKRR